MPKKKKKKKESWKERQRRISIKHQRALEAERIRRERTPKKKGGFFSGKNLAIIMFLSIIVVGVAVAASWNSFSPSSEEELPQLYTLTSSDLSEFRGKIVVIDFFATWCGPCKQEIPELAEINSKYNSSQVVVISVAPESEDEIKLRRFKRNNDMTWYVARDTVGLFEKYGIRFFPTIVILDEQGTVQFRKEQVTSALELSEVIDSILGGK